MLQCRPELEKLKEYVPGKSIREIQLKHGLQNVVKLASNENPLGPSPKAMEAFCATARELHLYPQGNAPELMRALSAELGVGEHYIIPGNGSDEILELVGRAFMQAGDRVLGATSTFSVYEAVTLASGAEYVAIPLRDWKFDLDAILAAIDARTRVVFICNPNNPTGTWLTETELLAFLEKVPATVLVVVDQAYCEFADAPAFPQLLNQLERFPNLLLTRTFSKIYGLAGLRVGYGVGSSQVVGPLWKVKPPFNVNLPAQFAAVAALADTQHRRQTLETTRAGRAYLEKELDALGMRYLETQANFVCVEAGSAAGELVAWLEQKGMIIRWLRNFGMPDWVRITFGLESENQLLVSLLKEWRAAHV